MIIKNKKAQGWGLDLSVALMIFMFSMTILYLFSVNYSKSEQEEFEKVLYDSKIVVENIISEGYPENWNKTNVKSIGILSQGKINKTKLEFFYNLTQTDYPKTKRMFDTQYDYFLSVEKNFTISSGEIKGIGKPGTDLNDINSKNLVRAERFTIYKNKPTKVYLYLWSK